MEFNQLRHLRGNQIIKNYEKLSLDYAYQSFPAA